MPCFNLKVSVDSVASALAATTYGATELHLCSNLEIGGTTPTSSLLELVREVTSLPINVLIKPHGNSYTYDTFEFEEIKREIISAKQHLADGVIIGMLENSKLDLQRLKVLIDLAKPMTTTLNGCFDLCSDPLASLTEAINLGFDNILTAMHTTDSSMLPQLLKFADGNINLIMDKQITPSTVLSLISTTCATNFNVSFNTTKLEELNKIKNLLIDHLT